MFKFLYSVPTGTSLDANLHVSCRQSSKHFHFRYSTYSVVPVFRSSVIPCFPVSRFNKELRCGGLDLKQTFQFDQPPLCYKAVLTRHLQSVSSFSSNDFTRWSPSVPQKMPKFLGQCGVIVPIVYTLLILSFETRGLFTCACATQILAAASIRERRLFRSARPEVRRQFESGAWSSKYGTLGSKISVWEKVKT